MSLAETIANAFGGAKRSGKGWMCKCPCHEDKTASLGVIDNPNKENDVIFNCLAGCEWIDIKTYAKTQGLIKTYHEMLAEKQVVSNIIYYTYTDESGYPVARKVRYPGKKFSIERVENGQWLKGLNGVAVPLYNLPAVIKSDYIYICEGEKDANNLIRCGLCATTNIAGAGHWNSSYNHFLKGKSVIICEDNDDAGRARTEKLKAQLLSITKQLLLFRPPGVAEHGDVSDWLAQLGNVTVDLSSVILDLSVAVDLQTIQGHKVSVVADNEAQDLFPVKSRKSKSTNATQLDYFNLFEKVLNNPKRCIFSEKLMTYEPHSRLWNPAINGLERVKSAALVLNETGSVKYNLMHIKPHFFEYESLQKPILLIEIPEWDGIDRIGELAQAVQLKESANVCNVTFEELLKEWCGRVFARLNDPMMQNRMLILQSNKQGIGKDTWIHVLCGGMNQWCVPLTAMQGDKDTYINLSRGLVCSVSEFDRTSRTEASVLKDLITAASSNLRGAYESDAKIRLNRCSFISSANVENLLRDSTGSRRFLVFELEAISYFYRTWTREQLRAYQMQCVAQMRALYRSQYFATQESWEEMNEYLEKQTPEDPADALTEQFLAELRRDLNYKPGKDLAMTDKTLIEVVKKVTERTRLSYNGAMTLLRNRLGKRRRIGSKRFWVLEIPQIEYNEGNSSGPQDHPW